MPIHDWTRVFTGAFHDFHSAWIFTIKQFLNNGLLPKNYYAMAEQVAGGLHLESGVRRPNEIAIRHVPDDRLVARIEIGLAESPDRQHALILSTHLSGPPKTIHIQMFAVGDVLSEMPLFLESDLYINLPLEPTYQAAFAATAQHLREALESPGD